MIFVWTFKILSHQNKGFPPPDFRNFQYSATNGKLSESQFHPRKSYFESVLDGESINKSEWRVISEPGEKQTVTLNKKNTLHSNFIYLQIIL